MSAAIPDHVSLPMVEIRMKLMQVRRCAANEHHFSRVDARGELERACTYCGLTVAAYYLKISISP